ncbi:hypothetical protein Hdeb2414_s1248g00995531 [Helianthus debilis subsp. tardiflorus]
MSVCVFCILFTILVTHSIIQLKVIQTNKHKHIYVRSAHLLFSGLVLIVIKMLYH